MKIVQSFWSGPKAAAGKKDALAIAAGWISPEYHWMSWALSCLQLTKYYDRVELVTDEPGRQVLIELLGLPYTSVSTALHESELDNLSPELWAMAKVYTYGLQQEPFLHVDGDVYIAAPFPEQLLAAPVVTQNPELNLPIYLTSLRHIERLATYLPPSLVHERQHATDVFAYNAGILGGTNLPFFQYFKREAFTFIERNAAVMPQLLRNECFNTIPEQYLLHTLAQERGVPVACLFEKPITDLTQYERFVDVAHFPHQLPYLHVIGAFKRVAGCYEFVANTLRREYPTYYYTILRLCRAQGLTLHTQQYHLPGLDPRYRTPAGFQSLLTRYLAGDAALPTTGNYSLRAAYEAQPARYFTSTLRVLAALPTPLALPQSQAATLPSLTAGLTALVAAISDESVRLLVADVLVYETQRIPYLLQLASDDYLYGRSMAHQASQTRAAALPPEEFFTQQFHTSATIGLVESAWDWTYDEDTDWAKKVSELLALPASNQCSAWLPNLMQLRLDELLLDEFDSELLHLCQQPRTGHALLQELSQQFPKEELAANWDAFRDMVYFSLKRALHYGLLKATAGPVLAPVAPAEAVFNAKY
ncbi:MAG: DUF6734 family protein [Janthinobacterium lividum]